MSSVFRFRCLLHTLITQTENDLFCYLVNSTYDILKHKKRYRSTVIICVTALRQNVAVPGSSFSRRCEVSFGVVVARSFAGAASSQQLGRGSSTARFFRLGDLTLAKFSPIFFFFRIFSSCLVYLSAIG